MLSEDERLDACRQIAERMLVAGIGWNYDAIERLTRPDSLHLLQLPLKLLPSILDTPVERGALDRYQDRRHSWQKKGP